MFPGTPTEPPTNDGDGSLERGSADVRDGVDNDEIDAAISAGCTSLIALEASLAKVEGLTGEHAHAESSIRAAIELIRSTISELQRLRDRSPLSLGFVRGRRRRGAR